MSHYTEWTTVEGKRRTLKEDYLGANAADFYNLWEDGMATPSTFVLDRTGKIRWQHIGKTVYDRPSNEEIIDQLRKLPKG